MPIDDTLKEKKLPKTKPESGRPGSTIKLSLFNGKIYSDPKC